MAADRNAAVVGNAEIDRRAFPTESEPQKEPSLLLESGDELVL